MMNKQSGWGFTELLISLFLVSLISTMLIQIYLISKRQFNLIHQSLDTQFDVQWVQELLTDRIRRDGFTPCRNIDLLKRVDRRKKPKIITNLVIHTKHNSELNINRMSERFGVLISLLERNQILVSPEIFLRKEQAVLIADCMHAELHEVIEIKKMPQGVVLTLAQPLLFHYSKETYVGQWLEEQWFIKDKALYYKQVHSEELTPLIHTMVATQSVEQNKKIVNVRLGFDKNKAYDFSVVVRS